MQLAHSADSNRAFWSPSTSGRRDKKLLLAGVAMLGASVIAVNPVAPALPTVADHAVELSAWQDPFAVWSNTIATTTDNVVGRGSDLASLALPAMWQIITSPDLYAEMSGILFNAVPGLTQFFSDLPGYAEIVSSGLAEASAGVTAHFDELPATLESAWDNVLAGQFTQAFADVVSWSIFGLGEAGWPLFPAFEIPGDIARGFGAEKIGEVLDLVFVGDGNAATGYAYSLLSPPITAAYQLTDILNVISGSLYEGDWESALSEIVNAPAKVLNAFLNGYQPSVAAEWETFPGLFSEDGPIDAFFVKLPAAIAEIFTPAEESEETGGATTDVTLVSMTSTEPSSSALLTVDVDVPKTGEAAATEDQAAEDGAAEEGAAEEGASDVVTADEVTVAEVTADEVIVEDAAEPVSSDDPEAPGGEPEVTDEDNAATENDSEDGDATAEDTLESEQDDETGEPSDGEAEGSADDASDSAETADDSDDADSGNTGSDDDSESDSDSADSSD